MLELNVAARIALAMLVSIIVSYAATPVVKSLAVRVGAMDVPKDNRRMHSMPIPRLGGLAIFFGFFLGVLLFAEINEQVRGVLLGAVIIVIIGIIDDIHPLRAWIKLLGQIAAALVAVFHGVVVTTLSNPNLFSNELYLNLGVFAIPITVIWIVGITNSVNLIDGLDGLAVGVSTISSLTMLIISLLVSDGNVAVILAALCGGCLGFIPYNKNPAKIFMGDTGALLLGYILATMSVMGLFKMYAIVSFAVPFLILGLPLFDTLFAIIRRVFSGRSPMSPDRGHFHHRLIDMGLNQKQAVAILYTISAVLGLCAVVLATSGEIRALVVLVAFCIAGGIGAIVYSSAQKQNNGEADGDGGDEESTAPDAPETTSADTGTDGSDKARGAGDEEN